MDSTPKLHGKQQNIKVDLLKWLNEGRNPFNIIQDIAYYLEEISDEPGYAGIVADNIRSVYGQGLAVESILSDELTAVTTRLTKLNQALASTTDATTQAQLKFAIEHHQQKIRELELKLQENA